jgi:hypothetical protein
MKKLKFILFVFLIFLIQGCNQNPINQGINYLDKIYDKNYLYNDNYIKFTYQNENLPLNLTYRKIDAYINLIYIKNEINPKKIDYQTKEAYDNLKNLIPFLENKLTYNTIKNYSDGYALDTYCIVGYLFKNTKIADNVNNLIINNNLIKDDYYKQDKWRNIADETWCILLLNKVNMNKSIVLNLTKIKIDETYNFINSENSIEDKVAVLIHTVMLLNELNYDNEFKEKLYELSMNEKIKQNILLESNILSVLSKSNYPKEKLKFIYALIKDNQNPDGGWYIIKNHGNAFITQRAILSLNDYERL